MATPLTLSTQADYNPNGTPEIYSSEAPYVRNANIILPGVDLTAIPAVGRGMLIAPDVVARAWHNRGAEGSAYTFVEQDGTTHQRTQIELSNQLGDDLVLARLDSPLPSAIKPMRIIPDRLAEYSNEERLYSYRVTYTNGHRLSLGDFDSVFRGTDGNIYDQNEIPGTNAHWLEAVNGDSGGANFMVINAEAFAIATTLNVGEAGTAVQCLNCTQIQQAVIGFTNNEARVLPSLWATDLNPEGRPVIPIPDHTKIYKNRN